MGRVVIASFVGGIVCFIWGALSWMVLDWHSSAFQSFDNEALVAKTLASSAPEPGVYLLPNIMRHESGRNATLESKAAAQKAIAEMQAGPYAYAIVRPGAKKQAFAMDLTFLWAFLRSLGACFVVALMVRQTKRLDYIQKVGFCVLCGIFAGLVTDVPMLVWFEAPLRYTLINMADHLCEWFLAGLAIGAIVQERETY
jgi:hypothetical protein